MHLSKLTLILFVLFFITGKTSAQNSEANNALKKITYRMEQSNTISCEINYLCKLLYSQKTERVKGFVEMIRSDSDRNFGCIFWYKVNDTLEKYYDGKTLFLINNRDKKIISQSANEGDLDLITQDLDGDLIRIPFVAPKSIAGLISPENKIKLKNYTKIKNAHLINVKYPNERGVTDAEMDLIFDKSTFDILKITSKMVFKGQTQSNEWNIINPKFGMISEKALRERFERLSNKYRKEKFQKPLHQFQNK
jgi:hypothetical protein